jgi:type II secretory pathway component GspD/PulD (secretin)
MSRYKAAVALAVVVVTAAPMWAHGKTVTYTPKHVPPAELQTALGSRESGGRSVIDWIIGGVGHSIEVRRNDPANLMLFSGDDAAVDAVQELVKAYDQAPRQIALEARIVEVDTDRARDLGIDWSQLSLSADGQQTASRRHQVSTQGGAFGEIKNKAEQADGSVAQTTRLSLANALHLLESKGAAKTRDVPRVITLNNRPATIFDGQRVTFTTRADGFAQIYVADTMDAGLKLEVTPSLVESGQLRLRLKAELTELAPVNDVVRPVQFATLAGSPIKRGQIVDNTIVARDGQLIVLGGFTRTIEAHSRQRFPILGSILPFLFSRDIVQQSHHESLITLTPRVVDLEVGPDAAQKKLIEEH